MKTIICSHGFAVRADSMGMFTDIKAALPEYEFRMFDYYAITPNGDQTVRSLDDQAAILQQQIDDTAEGDITLLCHSQGSTVAGLIDLSRVSRVILLAPPVAISRASLINRMRHRKGAKLNPHGMSIVPRTDGTTMYIPVEYMDSIEAHDRLTLYQTMATKVPTTIIRAMSDEVLGVTPLEQVKNATLIDIAADHNFTARARTKLIETLREVLL